MRGGRRHDLGRLRGLDPRDQFAPLRPAGRDRATLYRGGPLIQPQVRLALGTVRSVARKAVLREDGPNVPVELNARVRRRAGRAAHEQRDPRAEYRNSGYWRDAKHQQRLLWRVTPILQPLDAFRRLRRRAFRT